MTIRLIFFKQYFPFTAKKLRRFSERPGSLRGRIKKIPGANEKTERKPDCAESGLQQYVVGYGW